MLDDSSTEMAGHAQRYSASQGSLASEKLKMQRFLRWLEEQGAVFPFIEMKVRQGSRNIHARAPLGKGVLVMHIPTSLMITEEIAQASDTGKIIAANTRRINKNGYLAAYLLEAKREGGFWQPYIDVLPQDFSTHPVFFSNEELAQMQGTYASELIRNQLKRIDSEYRQIQECLPPEKMFTREEYAWARCVILSRVHRVTIDKHKTSAMTPLADMPDHDANANVRWEPESSQGFVYTARHRINAGEALTIDYGEKSNSDLLRTYGFCLDGNPNNQTEIRLPLMSAEHPFHEYAKNLGTTRDGKRVFIVSAKHDDADARALLSYLRLSFLRSLPGLNRNSSPEANDISIGFINQANETEALSMLHAACREQLERFTTSIEEDEALLRSVDLSINMRNAVRVRQGEKQVLQYFQYFAEDARAAVNRR